MELTLQVKASTTGKKAGKQSKKRARNSDAGVRFTTTTFGTETIDDEQYTVLPDNSLLNSKTLQGLLPVFRNIEGTTILDGGFL